MGILIIAVILFVATIVLTVLNIKYAFNIKPYVALLRRGMVRVRVRYSLGKEDKVVRGWAYSVDLTSIMKNPVSHSSSFVKVYVKGAEEVVVAFSTVKKLEVLDENFLSVVFVKGTYL